MRLVFMGTPEFARACLEKLHSDGFDIAAVYTKYVLKRSKMTGTADRQEFRDSLDQTQK